MQVSIEQGTGSGHEDGVSVISPPRRSVGTVVSKDRHRSGADTVTQKTPSSLPANRIENVDAPSATAKSVHFWPGTVSRREPTGSVRCRQTNPIAIGELGGCVTAGTETPGAAGSGVATTERRT